MLGNHGRSITKAIFTPLARVLARVGVTPNMVTVAGTVATVAIAVICIPQGWIWQGGIVLAVVMFGDSVDGTLARMTTGGTRFGAFLDSTLDRLGDGAVFGSLTAYAVFQMDDSASARLSVRPPFPTRAPARNLSASSPSWASLSAPTGSSLAWVRRSS